jgi:hypothetical protein
MYMPGGSRASRNLRHDLETLLRVALHDLELVVSQSCRFLQYPIVDAYFPDVVGKALTRIFSISSGDKPNARAVATENRETRSE